MGTRQRNPKTPKDNKTPPEDKTKLNNSKRCASLRSPLEGNPDKKQKESSDTEKVKPNMYESKKDNSDKDNDAASTFPMNKQQSFKSNEPEIEEKEEIGRKGDSSIISSLLSELKEIEEMILKLDAKVKVNHHDITTRVSDFSKMKELLTLQNDKIAMLYSENKELKSQNNTLEKELLEV